jgi:hypothetical protein
MKIKNPTSCEIWSVIKFLNAKKFACLEFTSRFIRFMEKMLSDGMVRRWYRMLSERKMNVHDDD